MEKEQPVAEGAVKRTRLIVDTVTQKDNFFSHLSKSRLEHERLVFDVKVFGSGDKDAYIRPCYKELHGIIFPGLKQGKQCIVTGTPGIGKSLFGFYCFRQLLDSGITVIYIYEGWPSCHLFLPVEPASSVCTVLASFNVSAPEKDGWYGRFINMGTTSLSHESLMVYGALTRLVGDVVVIVDPPKLWTSDIFENPECGLLVVSSPAPDRLSGVKSFGTAETYYMPLWTSDEIRDLLRSRKQGDLTKEEESQVALREGRFGPIPRYIANALHDHATMMFVSAQETDAAIKKLTGSDMAQVLNPQSSTPQISGRVVHMVVYAKFRFSRNKFASEMVQRQILVGFHRASKLEWNTFASSIRDFAVFKSAVGVQSEIWWHSALQSGGNFRLQKLTDKTGIFNTRARGYNRGPVQSVTLPESSARYSAKQDLSDIASLWDLDSSTESDYGGLYFNFIMPDVPALDSIWVLRGCDTTWSIFGGGDSGPPFYVCGVQMTVSKKHKLNSQGVQTLLNLANKLQGAQVEIIFVTNESLNPDFTYVPIEGLHLNQWLLTVPVERFFW